jgi:hypothetical protein
MHLLFTNLQEKQKSQNEFNLLTWNLWKDLEIKVPEIIIIRGRKSQNSRRGHGS